MQNETMHTTNEIGLKEAVDFLGRNLKGIAACSLIGLLLSGLYIVSVPKIYEVRMKVQMAKVGGVNIEESSALVQRLRAPTAYPVEVRQICVGREDEDIGDYLNGTLKAETIKNVPDLVDLKIRAFSLEQATRCAEKIVAMLVDSHRSLIKERLAGRQDQLALYQKALLEEQKQLESFRGSKLADIALLIKHEKMSWLRGRIDALQEEDMLSQLHPAKLVSPMHAVSKPVSPKVGLVLWVGLILGFMSGVLYAFGREGWRRGG